METAEKVIQGAGWPKRRDEITLEEAERMADQALQQGPVIDEPEWYEDPEFILPTVGGFVGSMTPVPGGQFAGETAGYMLAGNNPMMAAAKAGRDAAVGGVAGKVMRRVASTPLAQALQRRAAEVGRPAAKYIGDQASRLGRALTRQDDIGRLTNQQILDKARGGLEVSPGEVGQLAQEGVEEFGVDMPSLLPSMRAGDSPVEPLLESVENVAASTRGGRRIVGDMTTAAKNELINVIKSRHPNAKVGMPEFGRYAKGLVDNVEERVFGAEDKVWKQVVDQSNVTPENLSAAVDAYKEVMGKAVGLADTADVASKASKGVRSLIRDQRDVLAFARGEIGLDDVNSPDVRRMLAAGGKEGESINWAQIFNGMRQRVGNEIGRVRREYGMQDSDIGVLKQMYAAVSEAQRQFVPDAAAWDKAKAAHSESMRLLESVDKYVGDSRTIDVEKLGDAMLKDPDLATAMHRVAEMAGDRQFANVFLDTAAVSMLTQSRKNGFDSFHAMYMKLPEATRDAFKAAGMDDRLFHMAALNDRLRWAVREGARPGGGLMRVSYAVRPESFLRDAAAYVMLGNASGQLVKTAADMMKVLPPGAAAAGALVNESLVRFLKSAGTVGAGQASEDVFSTGEAEAASPFSIQQPEPMNAQPFTLGPTQ